MTATAMSNHFVCPLHKWHGHYSKKRSTTSIVTANSDAGTRQAVSGTSCSLHCAKWRKTRSVQAIRPGIRCRLSPTRWPINAVLCLIKKTSSAQAIWPGGVWQCTVIVDNYSGIIISQSSDGTDRISQPSPVWNALQHHRLTTESHFNTTAYDWRWGQHNTGYNFT